MGLNGPLRYKRSGKCSTGKRRYPTLIDAGVALGNAQRARPITGRDQKVEVRHYHCPLCHGYHLTSKPRI